MFVHVSNAIVFVFLQVYLAKDIHTNREHASESTFVLYCTTYKVMS